jgi:hypothetical protein
MPVPRQGKERKADYMTTPEFGALSKEWHRPRPTHVGHSGAGRGGDKCTLEGEEVGTKDENRVPHAEGGKERWKFIRQHDCNWFISARLHAASPAAHSPRPRLSLPQGERCPTRRAEMGGRERYSTSHTCLVLQKGTKERERCRQDGSHRGHGCPGTQTHCLA